jgi:uncharacterized membrane protein
MLWSAALLAAPTAGAPTLSALTYVAGSLVCHQRPERSFHLDGAQYPVCARCLGLYVGAVAGVFAWTIAAGVGRSVNRRAARIMTPETARMALLIAAVPTVATLVAAWFGWWEANNVVRAILALPLGAVIAALVAAVAAGDLR